MSDRLLTRTSSSTVAETVQRLIEALERRRITVFSRIDHAEGARSVGLELADEVVVIFGNPQFTCVSDGDPSRHEHAARIPIPDPGTSARLSDCSEEFSG